MCTAFFSSQSDVDAHTPSTITSHEPGYLLSKDEDVIKGMQTELPLKRSCKPKGGFRTVAAALLSYGYEPDEDMAKIFTDQVTVGLPFTALMS